MINKSELRASIKEALEEELDGALDKKTCDDLEEALLDRMVQDFDVIDDEDEDEEPEDEEEDDV